MNKSKSTKSILLKTLQAVELKLESDLKNDAQTKNVILYLVHLFKSEGIETLEEIVPMSRDYIIGQVQSGVDASVSKLSTAVVAVIHLIGIFFIVSVGLIFGAIAGSLLIGEILGNNALGFIVAGILWIIVMITALKYLFNKKRLENILFKKMKPQVQKHV